MPASRRDGWWLAVLTFWTTACASLPYPTSTSCATPEWATDQTAIKQSLALLGPNAQILNTAHFTLISTVESQRTRQLARTAEDTLNAVLRFTQRLQLPSQQPSHKLLVLFVANWPTYVELARSAGLSANEATPGFYDEANNRCVLFDFRVNRPPPATTQQNTTAASELEKLINRTVIRHEIAHHALQALGWGPATGRYPAWLAEGLAMQFEDEQPLNRARWADAQRLDEQYQVITAADLMIDPNWFAPSNSRAQQAYATAWAFVYYLAEARPGELARLVQIATAPTGPGGSDVARQQAENVLGKMDEAFEKHWREFVARRAITTSAPGNDTAPDIHPHSN